MYKPFASLFENHQLEGYLLFYLALAYFHLQFD